MKALAAGAMAPDFDVPAVLGSERLRFRLGDYRGKRHVVIAFYVLDWTPT